MSESSPPARAEVSAVRRFFEMDLLDNRYPVLHGMRFLAIISVVQYHVTSSFVIDHLFPIDPWWATRSRSVFFGMDLFFVLSGFLIGSILLRSIETSGSQQVRRFYLRRAFRTFPSYYGLLTFIVLAVPVPLTPIQRHNLPFEYTYLTDYALSRTVAKDTMMPWGWSLAVEEKFYLAVPLLFFMLRKLRADRTRLALLGALWLSALGVRLALYLRKPEWTFDSLEDALYFRSHTRYDTLVGGIILAYVQHRWHDPIARWLESRLARWSLGAPPLACLGLLLQPGLFGAKYLLLVHVFAWGTLTTIMYFAWVLLLLNWPHGRIGRALSNPIFRRLATLGYGVYLIHIPLFEWPTTPILRWLRDAHGWPTTAIWPVGVLLLLLLSLAWAYGAHLLIEKPSMRLRDRFAR